MVPLTHEECNLAHDPVVCFIDAHAPDDKTDYQLLVSHGVIPTTVDYLLALNRAAGYASHNLTPNADMSVMHLDDQAFSKSQRPTSSQEV